MIIHIVQPGDTISTIAQKYNISAVRILQDNGLEEATNLVHGQALVIAQPIRTYTVQEGDTISKIAENNGITLLQLLRNNPYLSDRKYIYPGENLVISYGNLKGKVTTNGYVNPFVNMDILKKTLPFLTYLTVFGYRILDNGEIANISDDEIILKAARDYRVVPIMMLSTLNLQGIGSVDAAYGLIYSENNIKKIIDNILQLLKTKGYKGINLTNQFITEDSRPYYENIAKLLTRSLHEEGYTVFITLSENFVYEGNYITFEQIDYTQLGKTVDGFTLLNFNWGYTYGPPAPVESYDNISEFVDYVNTKITPRKSEVGITTIGYDWELPYVSGVTKTKSLSIQSAITLANHVGAVIQFDEVSQTPYFRYTENKNGILRKHIVWFVDARTVDAFMSLINRNNNRGAAIWNIMNYFPQLWTVINTQYQIETLL